VPRNSLCAYVPPWTIVYCTPVPVPVVRAIPVASIKNDVQICSGSVIDIGVRYYDKFRRRGERINRRGAYIDTDTYTCHADA